MSLQSTVDRIEDFVSGSVTGGWSLFSVVIFSCDSFHYCSVRRCEDPVRVMEMVHGKTSNAEHSVWKSEI